MINLLELRTGRVQMADLIRDAAYEIQTAEIGYIQKVLNDAAASWATPFYGAGVGIVKGVLRAEAFKNSGSTTDFAVKRFLYATCK